MLSSKMILRALLFLSLLLEVFAEGNFDKSLEEFHNYQIQDTMWMMFGERLSHLEKELHKYNIISYEARNAIHTLASPDVSKHDNATQKTFGNVTFLHRNYTTLLKYKKTECSLQTNYIPRWNVQMMELYGTLDFTNTPGGVWTQGFEITYDEAQWTVSKKLRVIIVPYSHNDPGWLYTFEYYYASYTRQILDNIVAKLTENPQRKFVWSEISFLSLWWSEATNSKKDAMKKLVMNGQFEIVTGGWVMNDEATTHWQGMLLQLTEGHQWIQENLNITLRTGWNTDAFGYSPTMALLQHLAGLEHIVIHHVHYIVKKHLAQLKQLEFRWRQLWEASGLTDIFTHILPFRESNILYSCGPDPDVCCQFDFKRTLVHSHNRCPNGPPPVEVNDTNVAERAELLLNQFRMKAQLFQTNVVLVPLGDELAYARLTECDAQFSNYERLMKYINKNVGMHANIEYGTLTDYFKAVRDEKSSIEYPVLSGDFFTYADQEDHYWSGFYTTRPFLKRMDRVATGYLRAAELCSVLASLSNRKHSNWVMTTGSGIPMLLEDARKRLSMFQHHEAITGTSRDNIAYEYGEHLLRAIKNSQMVLQHSVNVLLTTSVHVPDPTVQYYLLDDYRRTQDSLPEKFVIFTDPEPTSQRIILFNSLTFTRHEVITLIVTTPYVVITDLWNVSIMCQVSPEYDANRLKLTYEVAFIATIPSLGLMTYTIRTTDEDHLPPQTIFSKLTYYNYVGLTTSPLGFPNTEYLSGSTNFSIYNHRNKLEFDDTGTLSAMCVENIAIAIRFSFATYAPSTTNNNTDGAYLFVPAGDAEPLLIENPLIRVIEGPVYSSVLTHNIQDSVSDFPVIYTTIHLYNSIGPDSLGIELHNIVDIRTADDTQLVMRITTNLTNGNNFFTDLNGFQLIRRQRNANLPRQGNYYPMTTMAYIEDAENRVTLLSGGSLGIASFAEGELEVMLDRHLTKDDHLGLHQGVDDNVPTDHVFHILAEVRTKDCRMTAAEHPAGFYTLPGQVASQAQLNPIYILIAHDEDANLAMTGFSPVSVDLGVDITMPVVRTGIMTQKNADSVGIVVHRQNINLCYTDNVLLEQFPLSDGEIHFTSLLPETSFELIESSITFVRTGRVVNMTNTTAICPMELKGYILQRAFRVTLPHQPPKRKPADDIFIAKNVVKSSETHISQNVSLLFICSAFVGMYSKIVH